MGAVSAAAPVQGALQEQGRHGNAHAEALHQVDMALSTRKLSELVTAQAHLCRRRSGAHFRSSSVRPSMPLRSKGAFVVSHQTTTMDVPPFKPLKTASSLPRALSIARRVAGKASNKRAAVRR